MFFFFLSPLWKNVSIVNMVLVPMLLMLYIILFLQSQTTLDKFVSFSLKKEKQTSPSKRMQRVIDKLNPQVNPSTSSKAKAVSKQIPKKMISRPTKRKVQLSSDSDSDKPQHQIQKVTDVIIGMGDANSMLESKRKRPSRQSKCKARLKVAQSHYLSSDDSDSQWLWLSGRICWFLVLTWLRDTLIRLSSVALFDIALPFLAPWWTA